MNLNGALVPTEYDLAPKEYKLDSTRSREESINYMIIIIYIIFLS